MKIIGAGLAGLLAAHAWPQAAILEAQSEPRGMHKALLRFRSEVVSKLTGIEFKPVTVRKGIWNNDEYVEPTIRLANMYAQKVTGELVGDRSIWNLDPVQRFIAPETFYEQLLDAVGKRVCWNTPLAHEDFNEPLVSTAPLPIMLDTLGIKTEL